MGRTLSTVAAATLLACSVHANANSGVVFVHGTGNQSDALNDCWEADYVNGIRKALPDPVQQILAGVAK